MDTCTDTPRDPRTIADLGDFVDSFVGSAKGALRSERDHIAFMVAKRSAEATGKLVGSIAAYVLSGLMMLFASLGVAIWAGRQLGDVVYGFGIVAAFYGLVAVVFGALWKGTLGERFILGLINSFHGH